MNISSLNKNKKAQLASAILIASLSQAAYSSDDEGWKNQIGLGLFFANVEGENNVSIPGTGIDVEAEVDVFFKDVLDFLDGGAMIAGVHEKDKWLILWDFNRLKLSDNDRRNSVTLDTDITANRYELHFGYQIADWSGHKLYGTVGARYNFLEVQVQAKGPLGRNPGSQIEEEWTDGVFGIVHRYRFNDEWSWENKANYGTFSSDGGWFYRTSVDWRFSENWSTNFWYSFLNTNIKEGSPGDKYYLKSDMDEFGFGLHINYHY